MNEETTTMHTFETPSAVDLKVELTSGEVDVATTSDGVTTVELEAIHGDQQALDLIANARVDQSGDRISVLLPKHKGSFFGRRGEVRATIRLPHESSMRVDTASADIEGRGRFGRVEVSTGSGDIELDQIASGDLKTGSGEVEVERVLDSIKVKTGSGDIKLGPVDGSVDLIAGSGDVELERVAQTTKIKTGSGDIEVGDCGRRTDVLAGSGDVVVRRVTEGEFKAKTGSGDISVGVADGTAAYLDIQTVTGDVTSELDATDAPVDEAPTAQIQVISGTGDVVLRRA